MSYRVTVELYFTACKKVTKLTENGILLSFVQDFALTFLSLIPFNPEIQL